MPDDQPMPRRRHFALRAGVAARATLLVSSLSRRLGLGSGSTIGGRVGLALDPSLLRHLGVGRATVLVSGTNGKTTTTRMLAEAVATVGEVASSRAGANMDAGLVAALAGSGRSARAILEVDEAHLPGAIEALSPQVVLLLNLSRDQLDRVSEVRLLADRWRRALEGRDVTVVANADDPLVVYAAAGAARTRFVGTGSGWHDDAYHCPRCDQRIEYAEDGWRCRCGFCRPELAAQIRGEHLDLADGATVALRLGVPGRFNVANAAMALIAAEQLGVPREQSADAVAGVREVEGRYARATIDGRSVLLLLAKNPAGFTELLELVAGGTAPVVVGINARIADGHDPSWLWDVPFELLAGREVIATGERAADLAVRLVHAGATVRRTGDQRDALAGAPEGEIEYIGNYTAFQDLRTLARRRTTGGPATVPAPPVHAPSPRARDGVSALRIVTVHPDLLGTYGDGGNATVLAGRARWRGIPVEVVAASSDRPLPEGGDVYLLGGGEDGPQLASTQALRAGALARAVDRGAVVLAVCAGYQIVGNAFPRPDGSAAPGLGLLDVTTARAAPRAVSEILLDTAWGPITGFENHGGRTTRASGVAPFGTIVAGVGNGDGTDGAVAGRVFGTYCHGPVLARNPALADALLELATGAPLSPLVDPTADALHAERLAHGPRERAQRVAHRR